ncbi:T9SS type A sorting domain-containing protein [Panacibacter ginsenosidivorans]|nr:T9SS type A sorting domain-containing protein [Panacibacter ginsenosidivorans]
MKALNRFTVFFVSLLFISSFVHAQLYKVDLDEKVQKSSLIIEGKVVGKKSFWNEDHSMIYTTNTIDVYKSFKGDIKEKQVEVVTIGGTVDLFYIEASDLLVLEKGQTGIFFCQPNVSSLKSPITKKGMLDIYSSDQGFLRYDEAADEANAPFANYKGIEKNLYNLLQQKTGRGLKIINNSYKVNKVNTSNAGSTVLAASISSFSPTTVHGGTLNDPANNTLTINGSGFGATPSGSCAVKFKDGNSASTSPTYSIPYYSSYIVSWSDTKIEIKVPSRAATGKIAVVISNGTSNTSVDTLNVFYSVLNAEFIYGGDTLASEPRLMNTNSLGGYSFLYSTSTAGSGKNFNTAPEKATFLRAITTWKEQVGVNFIEGGTTTTQAVSSSDNKNVIMFDNKNTGNAVLPSGVLATTYGYFSACTKTSTTLYQAQKIGFDMVVRNNGVSAGTTTFTVGPCFPQGSDLDLEMVILHELGHALNLAHINDDLESSNGNNALYINPSKLMHYAITNYVDRRSLDVSAYQGALYTTTKQSNSYGVCSGAFTSEMTPLSYTVISNDNCPASFPTTPTTPGTIVNFDLVHATSNKLSDPQFTAINCGVVNGQFVVNNAFYAIKTNGTSNSSLNILISNYATTPAGQADTCSGQGIRLAVYDVNSCPAGQNYPQPIACRTFTGNGSLSAITGLSANHNYLLYFDGLRNTKAIFNATLNGTALPLTLSKFYGEYVNNSNKLYIDILQAVNVKTIRIDKSTDGNNFTAIGSLEFSAADLVGKHTYIDALPFAGNNYYRIAIINNDGSLEYSNVILLKNDAKRLIHIYPNPVKDVLNINITTFAAEKYNYSVFDISGRLLINKSFDATEGTQTIKVPLNNVAAGTYLVKITDAKGNIVAKQNVLKQ